MSESVDASEIDSQRLDLWLWHARFFKTRALAATLAGKSKVWVNGQRVSKAHYLVRPGDVLTFAQGKTVRVVRVVAFAERRGSATQAAGLYTDVGAEAE